MASRHKFTHDKVIKITLDNHGNTNSRIKTEQVLSVADIYKLLLSRYGYADIIDITKISLLDENGKVKASVKCEEM